MIAFLSDIHGNYPALKSVLNEIDKLNCDMIISLGDVVGYYCMINECITELKKRNVINILGNHDEYLINGFPNTLKSKTVRLCLEYHKNIIAPENYIWLKNSVNYIDNRLFSARHAGWNDYREERFTNFDFSCVEKKEQVLFLSGHTHIQSLQKDKGKIYCNPGSVGQPRDGDSRAGYAVWDGHIHLYRVSYDVSEICNEMKRQEFGEWIYKGLYLGKGI